MILDHATRSMILERRERSGTTPITSARGGDGIVCGCRAARHEGWLELMATILHSTSLVRISTDTNGVSLGAGNPGDGPGAKQTPGIPRGARNRVSSAMPT